MGRALCWACEVGKPARASRAATCVGARQTPPGALRGRRASPRVCSQRPVHACAGAVRASACRARLVRGRESPTIQSDCVSPAHLGSSTAAPASANILRLVTAHRSHAFQMKTQHGKSPSPHDSSPPLLIHSPDSHGLRLDATAAVYQ